jgi:hypothetical protein
LTTVPLRRSSPLEASSSKTPKRQVRGVSTGMPISALLWAKQLYTFPNRQFQQNSNQQFIRGLKSFCFKGGERHEQMMTE